MEPELNQAKVSDSSRSRMKLEQATRLHWFHWVVVVGSLVLTFFAWNLAKNQVNDRVERQFDREAQRVIASIKERMKKYEDALWAGVALYETLDGQVTHENWVDYSTSISIEEKYPGISGLGFITRIQPEQAEDFERAQQQSQPNYKIHPQHDQSVSYPITYIEPFGANRPALGLDIAHEENRFTAAEKARKTKSAQITGPIVLVQDSNNTPGFLFYAPYYNHDNCKENEHRDDCMKGMVYAPFVVKNLMLGTLSEESRHVNIRLSDGGEVLFDELVPENDDFDEKPLHAESYSINVYGRVWDFEIQSDNSFRMAQKSSQPKIILFGGIFIDSMIFALFVLLARANKQALAYADKMNDELEIKNSELEQYVYSASHDLKSPLFSIQGFAYLLKQCIQSKEYDTLPEYIRKIEDAADKMRSNIEALLEVSRVGTTTPELKPENAREVIQNVIHRLDELQIIPASSISLHGDATVLIDSVRLGQVFENLIGNAAKYAHPDRPLEVAIQIDDSRRDAAEITVADNGIGIPQEYRSKVFGLFQRLSHETEGNGVGLSIVKRVIESFGGRVWLDDSQLGGLAVCMSIPKAKATKPTRAA